MSPSILFRVATAVTVLAATASAAFDLASPNNVAVYWGQGDNQQPLSDVCDDPNYDTVILGFFNGFPQKRGDYPASNFGMYTPCSCHELQKKRTSITATA